MPRKQTSEQSPPHTALCGDSHDKRRVRVRVRVRSPPLTQDTERINLHLARSLTIGQVHVMGNRRQSRVPPTRLSVGTPMTRQGSASAGWEPGLRVQEGGRGSCGMGQGRGKLRGSALASAQQLLLKGAGVKQAFPQPGSSLV